MFGQRVHLYIIRLDLDVQKEAPRTIRNAAPSIARNSLDRAVAGVLLSLLVASHANGEERPAPHHASVTAALSAAHRFSPYPYPSETRDRRSWALLRPRRIPKTLRERPEMASEHDGGCGGTSCQVSLPSHRPARYSAQSFIRRRLRSTRAHAKGLARPIPAAQVAGVTRREYRGISI